VLEIDNTVLAKYVQAKAEIKSKARILSELLGKSENSRGVGHPRIACPKNDTSEKSGNFSDAYEPLSGSNEAFGKATKVIIRERKIKKIDKLSCGCVKFLLDKKSSLFQGISKV
jgi:hypothetical protein